MALPTKSITWDNLESSTTSLYEKVLKDNIGKTQPTLAFLRKNNKTYTGGNSITEPLIYALTATGGPYEGYQTLTVADQKSFTTADYHIAHYQEKLSIAYTDMEKNRGNAQIFNLLEAKFKVLQMTMEQLLTTGILGTGTASPTLIGLRTAVPSSANTLGGIDGSVETWWDCKRDTTTTLATLTFGKLQDLYGECADGTEFPNVGITTQAIFNALWKQADARQQRGVEDTTVSLGFKNIEFNGVPIIVDKSCPAGFFWFLNTEYIYLRQSDTDNMKFSDNWLQNTEQMVKVKYLTWTGQVVCSNRRRQGVFSALS